MSQRKAKADVNVMEITTVTSRHRVHSAGPQAVWVGHQDPFANEMTEKQSSVFLCYKRIDDVFSRNMMFSGPHRIRIIFHMILQ